MKTIRIILLALVLIIVCLPPVSVQAIEPYKGYTYNSFNTAVPSQIGYVTHAITTTSNIKDLSGAAISDLKTPSDMFIDSDGGIYILDSGNGRVVVTDENFNNSRIISDFKYKGQILKLVNPTGLFVDRMKKIYIADSGNARVIICDIEGNVFNLLTKPQSDLIPSDYIYKPSKVVADNSGYIYVISAGLYQGAVVYDTSGTFYGFYGSNRVQVTLNLLGDLFWKKLMTKKQNELISQYVPDEFYNFDIDNKGFIYTCTQSSAVVTDRVKKLNPKGVNVLRNQNSFGDLEVAFIASKFVVSQIVDINVDENGLINILDSIRGRIFQYDNKGNLLLIYGGIGQQEGTFKLPVAIESYEDKIYVLDSAKASITTFIPTEFGIAVHKAVNSYNDGLYEDAKSEWEKVLKLDSNYQMAYNGIAKALMAEGNNDKAQYYYQQAQNRAENSKAFALYRTDFLKAKFPLICFIAIILLAGLIFLFRYLKKHRLKDKKEIEKHVHLSVLFHPVSTTEELKNHKKFSYFVPAVIVLLFFAATILKSQATGFRFNYSNPDDFNIFFPFVQTIVLFIAFVSSNWGVCTLLDGKGRFREIFTVCGYSLIPYTATIYISVLLSHLLTIEEWIYVVWLLWGGMIWSIAVLVGGLLAIHQYTLKKTIISLLLTMLGIAIIAFIVFLAFGLIQQSISFFGAIISELLYRLK